MNIRELAGKIMGMLEAFEGSKPAMDTPQMLIVRGMSRKKFDPEKLDEVISNVLNEIGAQKIEVYSDEAKNIIGIMDENIRGQVDIQGDTDIYGIYRLKESFEAMNCSTEYVLGCTNDFGVFIVMWVDKSGVGPRFVEIVVVNLEI